MANDTMAKLQEGMEQSVLNCTAVRTQWESIKEELKQADILCLSETRLTKTGQQHFEGLLAAAGFRVVWGAPKKRKRFGSRVTPGGWQLQSGIISPSRELQCLRTANSTMTEHGWYTPLWARAPSAYAWYARMGTPMPPQMRVREP